MFEIIRQWLNKPSPPRDEKPPIEPQEPARVESVIDNFDGENYAKLNAHEKSSQTAIASLEAQLDSVPQGETLSLWPAHGEYPGPIFINHPLTLDGQGATIWAHTGPVLSIESDRVILKNLRIEVTGLEDTTSSEQDYCSILIQSGQGLEFHDVEVRGTVMGLPEQEGEWKYPNPLDLGTLASGTEYNLRLRIVVPVSCKIVSDISGLEFEPHNLNPGRNEIQLHLEQLPPSTLINGSIFLVSTPLISTSLKRRISLTARIQSFADEQLLTSQKSIVWEPEDWNFVDVPKSQVETGQQQVSPVQVSKTRQDVKPNVEIFRSNSGNIRDEEQPEQEDQRRKQLGGAFTIPNQESKTQPTRSSAEQLSEPPLLRTTRSNRPSSIFNNPKPTSSESIDKQEDS